jgi:hypothetical protein
LIYTTKSERSGVDVSAIFTTSNPTEGRFALGSPLFQSVVCRQLVGGKTTVSIGLSPDSFLSLTSRFELEPSRVAALLTDITLAVAHANGEPLPNEKQVLWDQVPRGRNLLTIDDLDSLAVISKRPTDLAGCWLIGLYLFVLSLRSLAWPIHSKETVDEI